MYHCSSLRSFLTGIVTVLVICGIILISSSVFSAEIPRELSNFRDQLVVEPEPGKKLLPARKVIITDTDIMVDPKYPSPDYYIFKFEKYKNIRVFEISKDGTVIEIKITDEGNIRFGDKLYSLPASFEK